MPEPHRRALRSSDAKQACQTRNAGNNIAIKYWRSRESRRQEPKDWKYQESEQSSQFPPTQAGRLCSSPV